MRAKLTLSLIFIISVLNANWIGIKSDTPVPAEKNLISSNISTSTIAFNIDGFHQYEVETSNGVQNIVKVMGGASLLEAGNPDLQQVSASIIIPDDKEMDVRVVSSAFEEFENIEIAPSKGNLKRTQLPKNIPYEWNKSYSGNKFYPGKLADLREPYILRDNRGQSVVTYPFQYNPVTKTLRVYTEIVVEVYEVGEGRVNVKHRSLNRSNEAIKYPYEFKEIYDNHFLNSATDTRFEYLVDQGNMLIISYPDFMDEMEEFVEWKNKKGIPTEIVSSSTAGGNATTIQNYVEDYYYENGLTFLLLVGDYNQIGSPSLSGSASDPSYGFIEGNDQYNEVIVGRFSANSPSEVTTQVERSIAYEQTPEAGGQWYSKALSVGSNEGPGYQGLDDDEFLEQVIKPILLDYTYNDHTGIYNPNTSVSQGENAINNGVGVINYTGHGYQTGWNNGSPLTVTNINGLTNVGKLPFVWTVGCNVGEFNSITNSFAESWLRATHNGEPTGGIGHFGSTIPQSWEPPMHAQWAFNKILTESYDNHKTRTYGGISVNGCLHMNDAQGTSGTNETKYWTLFGDPSLVVRTAAPTAMNASYNDIIIIGQQSFNVSQLNEGDLVALSRNGDLIASAYASSNGQASLELQNASSIPGTLDLVITGFNKLTYESTVTVISPDGAFVIMNDIDVQLGGDNVISSGETIDVLVSLENVGNENASNISVNLVDINDDPFVSLLNDSESVNNLNSNSSTEVELSFIVSNSTPFGYSFTLDIELEFGDESSSTSLNLSLEALNESFELSGFDNHDWSFGGDADWSIDTGNASNGDVSAQSGAIDHNMTSELSLTMEVVQDGYIKFDKMVSCENVGSSSGNFYDYLAFYIDGVEQQKWAGEVAWSQSSFAVSAGEHTFKWLYNKDQGVVSGADAVWIDNIEFPPCVGSGNFLPGDVDFSGEVNVLDIVIIINIILGISESNSTADVNQDGSINVLDVVSTVNIILGSRGVHATSAELIKDGKLLNLYANGIVDVIDITLSHNNGISFELTNDALIAQQLNSGDETRIIIVEPTSHEILVSNGTFNVKSVSVANSNGFIDVNMPIEFSVTAAYPNPFNPSTHLAVDIPENGQLKASVYNLNGKLITELFNDNVNEGIYDITWNAHSSSSGLYFLRINYNDVVQTQKIMLIK